MRGIDMRTLLLNFLAECSACSRVFYDNVPLIADDYGELTDEQVEAVFIDLCDRHQGHDVQ